MFGLRKKVILLIIIDLTAVLASLLLATWIRADFSFETMSTYGYYYHIFPLFIFVHAIVLFLTKMHKTTLVAASIDEAILIATDNFIATAVMYLLKVVGIIDFPGSIMLMHFLIITAMTGFIHFSYRILRAVQNRYLRKPDSSSKRAVLIYGAGKAGRLLAKEIAQNDSYDFKIVGYIDDAQDLTNQHINGHRILGTGEELPKIVQKYQVDELIIAMPGANRDVVRYVTQTALKAKIKNLTMMSTSALLDNSNLKKTLRKVEIKDLLNRQEIRFNNEEIYEKMKGKTILITGAGGSIGSELVRQLFGYDPQKLVLFDISETGLYAIQQELAFKQRTNNIESNVEIVSLIGSIRDYDRLETVFSEHNFDYVFHAAAHKHVPLMETSPQEAIKNNIFGTRNLIKLSNKYKIKEFINISTDKAVNPTNVMGATKRFIEMMLQSQITGKNRSKFVAVRFGNVLGSNGSVIPLFEKQIAAGGPVTVTHPDIIRYFMTIPEAVSLVLQSAVYADNGNVFVLDMGEPVKIRELAERMIELSGYEVDKDIKIEYIGLRPGEKLYEELLMEEEGMEKTANNLIYIAPPMSWSREYIRESLKKLRIAVAEYNQQEIIQVLEEIVPTFNHDSNESET